MRNGRTVPQCGKPGTWRSVPWLGSNGGSVALRFAAGVCVLTAGLVMGAGGGVAVADPDSSGSAATGDDGTNASSQGSATASSPVGNDTDTQQTTIQHVTSTFGSDRQPGEQPSTGTERPQQEPGGTDPTT